MYLTISSGHLSCLTGTIGIVDNDLVHIQLTVSLKHILVSYVSKIRSTSDASWVVKLGESS